MISNHSGGIPTDGFLISAANIFEHVPHRFVHAMVYKFMNNFPFLSPIMRKLDQMVGLPANARSVLRDDRALLVFPEGAVGTGKLYYDRYKLIRFGTGFMRIAMETNTPIVPVGFIGGGRRWFRPSSNSKKSLSGSVYRIFRYRPRSYRFPSP